MQEEQNKRLIIDERTDIHLGNFAGLAGDTSARRGGEPGRGGGLSHIAVHSYKNDHARTPSRAA